MSVARWASLPEAVGSIPDGSLVAFGGFMLGRAPIALALELVRQKRRELKLVSLPNPLPAELLVAAGCAARVDFLFLALTLDGRVRPMPCLKRAIETGSIAWAEHDGYRIVQRLRAAAMGLPFLPAPDANVSALARQDPPGVVVDPFNGELVQVERALSPDVALVHAHAADARGNLFIEDPTTDLVIAGAAKRVVATVEQRVDRLPRVTIPAFQVEQVVEVPRGAWPTGCAGRYGHDAAAIQQYLALAEQGRQAEFLADAAARIRASEPHSGAEQEALEPVIPVKGSVGVAATRCDVARADGRGAVPGSHRAPSSADAGFDAEAAAGADASTKRASSGDRVADGRAESSAAAARGDDSISDRQSTPRATDVLVSGGSAARVRDLAEESAEPGSTDALASRDRGAHAADGADASRFTADQVGAP